MVFSLTTVSRVVFFCCLLAVTTLALVPQEHATVSTGWDKANHLLAFFVLLWSLDFSWPFKTLDMYLRQQYYWPMVC